MRLPPLFTALALMAAPVLATPSAAYADGIERPRAPRPRPRPAPQAVLPAPRLPVIESGPETVTLSNAFFVGAAGGVGADIGGGSYTGSTVVIRGGLARSSAFDFASARARAGGRGHSGGHGCGCR